MFDGMNIVMVTPAGRKRYLEILLPYILRLRPILDEYRLWVNTTNDNDINYMKSLNVLYPDFIKLEFLPEGITVDPNCVFKTICKFFKNCIDINTIYVRVDDDVVYLDDIDKFTQFIKFRKEHDEYLLVFGNIINNAICTHLHQRQGMLQLTAGISGYKCTDDIGWWTSPLAPFIHHSISQTDDLSKFNMNNWLLFNNERVSINVISWLGSEFLKFNGEIDSDEENYLACVLPGIRNKYNIIYGKFVSVHYAFGPQRASIDGDPSILNGYFLRSKTLKSNLE